MGSWTNGDGVGVRFVENWVFVEFFKHYRGIDASENRRNG